MKKSVSFCFILYGVCLMFTLFTLASCSRDQSTDNDKMKMTVKNEGEKIKLKTEDATITVTGNDKKGQVNIKTDDGETLEMTYGKNTIPDDFPKDVPIYSPSQVTMSQIINENNSVLSLHTDDEVSKVAEFYKKELVQQGWSIKNEMTMGTMSLLQGEKGKRALNVTVNHKDKKTVISIVVGMVG